MGMFFHEEFLPHQQNRMRVLTSDGNLQFLIGKVCTGVELGPARLWVAGASLP